MGANMNTYEIKALSDRVFDVFWGKGWENWARIQNNKGFLKQIGGEDIPRPVFSSLIQQFSTKE